VIDSLTSLRRLLVAIGVSLAAAPAVSAHSPHDEFHVVAVSPDFTNDGTMMAVTTLSQTPMLSRTKDGGKTWELFGSPMVLDTVNRLVYSPDYANDKTMFAAGDNSGVWRSTDGGDSWAPMNNGLADLGVKDISLSAGFAFNRMLIAVTQTGVYRSTNAGASWTLSNQGIINPPVMSAVTFTPIASVVFAGGKTLYYSIDGGVTWSPVQQFPNLIKGIAISPNFFSDATVAAFFGGVGAGVELSTDQGVTFTPMNTGLTDLNVNRVVIATDGTFFACTKDTLTGGVFRAPSAGGSWTRFINDFQPFAVLTNDHFRDLALSPDFATDGIVALGAHEGFYITEDRGDNWHQSDVYTLRILRELEISPDYANDRTFFAGSYGGSFMSYDELGTGTWKSLAIGLPPLWSSHLSLSPDYLNDDTIFYAYSELWKSQDRGASWSKILTPVVGGTGTVRAFDTAPGYPSNPTMLVGYGDGLGTFLSVDDGQNWIAPTGLPVGHAAVEIEFSPNFAVDQTIFVATVFDGVLRSTDGGQSFVPVPSGLPTSPVLITIAVSPDFANDGTVFAGTAHNGLFKSSDWGTTWVGANMGMVTGLELTIEKIELTDTYASDQTAFCATLADGVYLTTNGGQSWTRRDSGLPLLSPWEMDVSPDYQNDKTVVLATSEGVYRTEDAGLSWHPLTGYNRADDRYPGIHYEGTWTEIQQVFSTGNLISSAGQAGDACEWEFLGDEVSWLAERDGYSGIAEIFVDGVSEGLFDLYLPGSVGNMIVFTKTWTSVGWHKIRVEATGTKSAAALGTLLQSDGFSCNYKNVDLTTTLSALPLTVSVSQGGSQSITLDTFGSFPGDFYLVAGTLGQTSPGFPLQGFTVPLAIDSYFLLLVNNPNLNGIVANNFGALDSTGKATATFTLSGGALPPGVVGAVINHAAVVFSATGQVLHASNPAPLTFSF
jgi:photosystem II stability/assembly factor-like uncharacterized protein